MDIKTVDLVMRAIREDKDFRLKFSEAADEIIDKVYTYYRNPSCTCSHAIVAWINSNATKTTELINKFKSLFEKLNQTPTQVAVEAKAAPPVATTAQVPAAQPPPNQVMKIGEVEIIDPTPEAYATLYETIKSSRWVFRGMNVVPGIRDGKEVWFVLFY